MSCCETTPRRLVESMVRTCGCLSAGNALTRRSTVAAAPLVCSVPMTRMPISAAVTAMLMVSRSRKLADQNDVGILAQRRQQRAREGGGVHADLALADQAVLAQVHELDRILDGEDVALFARVDVIDHGGERGGLAGAGLAGDQDQAVVDLAQIQHGLAAASAPRRCAPWREWRGTPRPCRSAGA